MILTPLVEEVARRRCQFGLSASAPPNPYHGHPVQSAHPNFLPFLAFFLPGQAAGLMSREATMLLWRREVRCLRLLSATTAPNTYGGSNQQPLPGRAGCDPVRDEREGRGASRIARPSSLVPRTSSGSRPRNSTVPPAGRAKRQADLGKRAGGAVAPVRGSPS